MKEGLGKIIQDLGLKNIDELYNYLNAPENQDNPIVKEFKEFINYVKEKQALERLSSEEIKEKFGIVEEGDIVSSEDLER